MWKDITYACGHTVSTSILGNAKDRESKIEWLKDQICPACFRAEKEKQRAAEAAKAAADAAEMGLPSLVGSSKQVAWAETLRVAAFEVYQKFLSQAEKLIQTYAQKEMPLDRSRIDSCIKGFDALFSSQVAAEFWIDHRTFSPGAWAKLANETGEKIDKAAAEATIVAEVDRNVVVRPEDEKKPGIVRISCERKTISLRYQKDDDFRALVKASSYSWDADKKCWERKITSTCGTTDDRMAEIANALLRAGFSVALANAEIREKAINADYEPEQHNWIFRSNAADRKDLLGIKWGGRDDKIYSAALRISGSKYCAGAVFVPVQYWKQVYDFAELNGFSISKDVLKMVDEYESATRVTPAAPTARSEAESAQEKLAQILVSGDEILDDLKD